MFNNHNNPERAAVYLAARAPHSHGASVRVSLILPLHNFVALQAAASSQPLPPGLYGGGVPRTVH